MTQFGRERRAGQRYSLTGAVHFRVVGRGEAAGIAGSGSLVNMSTKGVLFTTDTPPPVGQDLILNIDWPGSSSASGRTQLSAKVRVVRVNQDQVAVAILRYEFAHQEDKKGNRGRSTYEDSFEV